MSVYLAMCFDDRVELLTDGASYTPDGILRTATEKVVRVDAVPAAITARGIVALIDPLEKAVKTVFEKTRSYDATITYLERFLPTLRSKENSENLVEMAIAGISETKGPIVHFWSSVSNWTADGGLDAFTLYSTRRGVCGGVVFSEDQFSRFHAHAETLAGPVGINMIETLRRQKVQNLHTGEDDYFIGAHIDCTTITAAGVSTSRIHTWPEDKVGERLAIMPDAPNVVPMNRQQRRAAERAASKGRAVA